MKRRDFLKLSVATAVSPLLAKISNAHPYRAKIFSHYRAGSHLLEEGIRQNFRIPTSISHSQNDGTMRFTMIRDGFDTMTSAYLYWRSDPEYHRLLVDIPFSDFLRGSFLPAVRADTKYNHHISKYRAKALGSPIHCWINYMESIPPGNMVVRYDEIVRDQESVYDRAARHFNLPQPESYITINSLVGPYPNQQWPASERSKCYRNGDDTPYRKKWYSRADADYFLSIAKDTQKQFGYPCE